MDIYALDYKFDLVSIGIPYSNLQWTRRYYEAGEFMVELPLSVYDASWKYIGTSDRPELGVIQKIEQYGEGDVNILLSGFFCEKLLDDDVCYPRYKGNAANTETAVRNIFTKYYRNDGELDIQLAKINNPPLGDRTQSDFSDDELGKKLYSILESRECSFRIEYSFEDNVFYFKVWQGKDRTQSQNKNSFQVFSTEFGNIVDKSTVFDSSDYKNYAYIPVNANDNGVERDCFYVQLVDNDRKKAIVIDMRASVPGEDQSYSDFRDSCIQEATEILLSYAKVEDIDIVLAGNKGYMLDYDLGDKCDVVLTDIGIQMETRIVEVLEVFKADGGHEVTLGLGNRRIDNIRRAVQKI